MLAARMQEADRAEAGKWMRLALKAARRYTQRWGGDHEEFAAAAMPALMRSVQLYRPDQGTKFHTYAWMALFNEFRAHDKFLQRGNGKRVSENVELDVFEAQPGEAVISRKLSPTLSWAVAKVYPLRRRRMLRAWLGAKPHERAMSCPEIGRMFGISKETVRLHVKAAVRDVHRRLAARDDYEGAGLARELYAS